MKRNKEKGFTLIELIAVLVILAVIALIVTPLVLNIVKKAKDSANKRSVDAYGKATELAVATYLLDNGEYPTTIDDLTVEYSGNEVVCNVKTLNEDGSIYLSECSVAGTEVKDSSTEDGWYHFGQTVTYNVYNIGDTVTYNGMDFYVIANSDSTSDSVTLLKAEPLTVDEVNTYGVGHINKYPTTASNQGIVGDLDGNGYGGMAYYSSETCGLVNNSYITDGCTTDYDASDVKYAVDAWALDKFDANDLTKDSLGYSARLITYDELVDNLGYNQAEEGDSALIVNPEYTPSWVYNSKYRYWTMSPYDNSSFKVWRVNAIGYLGYGFGVCDDSYGVVRPVVTLLKSAL